MQLGPTPHQPSFFHPLNQCRHVRSATISAFPSTRLLSLGETIAAIPLPSNLGQPPHRHGYPRPQPLPVSHPETMQAKLRSNNLGKFGLIDGFDRWRFRWWWVRGIGASTARRSSAQALLCLCCRRRLWFYRTKLEPAPWWSPRLLRHLNLRPLPRS